MGNCKSSAAASSSVTVAQNGNGMAAYDSLKQVEGKGADASTVVTADASTVTTDRKPLLQIQTDGNVEVPNGGLALSPTAELSEATSKDSQDTSSQKSSSERQSVAEKEESEEDKVDGESANNNDNDDHDDSEDDEDIPPPPPRKPTSAQNTSSNELVTKGDVAPAYSLVLPFVSGKIPTSVLQMASDLVMPEGVNALTSVLSSNSIDGETTKKSVWALDPTAIVAGAAATLLGDDDAKAASTANTTMTTLVKAEKKKSTTKRSTIDDAEVESAPSDEVTVDGDHEDIEVDPEAVIVSYKQKASQWAIDDAMKGSTKRRGPRPEDCDFSSVRRKSKRSVASAKR